MRRSLTVVLIVAFTAFLLAGCGDESQASEKTGRNIDVVVSLKPMSASTPTPHSDLVLDSSVLCEGGNTLLYPHTWTMKGGGMNDGVVLVPEGQQESLVSIYCGIANTTCAGTLQDVAVCFEYNLGLNSAFTDIENQGTSSINLGEAWGITYTQHWSDGNQRVYQLIYPVQAANGSHQIMSLLLRATPGTFDEYVDDFLAVAKAMKPY